MAWLRVDDGFVENPKIADLKDRSFRLHLAALCYCARNLTDGLLTERAVRVTCAIVSAGKRNIVELVDAGLWLPTEDAGFWVKDYTEYNPTAEKVKADRARNAERQQRHRDRSNPDGNDARNGVTNDAPSPPLKELPRAVPVARPEQPSEHIKTLIDESLEGANAA